MMFDFSYVQEKYDEFNEHGRRYLKWTNDEKTWNYKNCTATVISNEDGVHIVIRRERDVEYRYKNPNYVLSLMMGFTATDVQPKYSESNYELIFTIKQSQDRYHRDLKNVKLAGKKQDIGNLYDIIQEKIKKPKETNNIIAPEYKRKNPEMLPAIYQPRVDAWNNSLLEINVNKNNESYNVILAFQGEVIRKFILFDPFYKIYRFFRYRRTVDIETFEIRKDKFYFKNIYSGINTLFDSTHNEAETGIKYYFSDDNHPVIFINTSNHAMAPHDNNHDFWKWEYVPWSETTPLICGEKTKKQTEKSYRRF